MRRLLASGGSGVWPGPGRLVAGLLLALGVLGVGSAIEHRASGGATSTADKRCSPPRRQFAVYYLGASFAGYPFRAAVRKCPYSTDPSDNVTVLYGDCNASDGGCLAPIEVVSGPLCQGDLNHASRVGPQPHRFRIRGVPAAVFDSSLNGSSVEVEVYTGHTAVAVTTAGVGHAMNAARAIELAPPALQRPPTGAGLRRLSGAKALPRRPPPLPAPVGYSLKPRPPCH